MTRKLQTHNRKKKYSPEKWEEVLRRNRESYHRNKAKYKKTRADYLKKNIKKLRKDWRKYIANRRRNDPVFRILARMRSRLWMACRTAKVHKKLRTSETFGCTSRELREHLESTFKPGMHWGLGNKIHIDHIRPCASFDLTKEEEQKKCFHFSNLQMLWAEENLKKHDKYENHQCDHSNVGEPGTCESSPSNSD